MRALRRLLWAWWTVVRDPRRIRGGEFPFGFMLAVSFYLGFLYNTFHFFLYPGYIKEEFHAGLAFWLHSLYGGTSGLAGFLMAGVGGHLGLRLLRKRISYQRWEALLFSLGFIALLPVLLGALFILVGFTGPTGKVVFWSIPLFPKRLASCVVITLVLGSLLFLRLFRSLGLGVKGLAVMGLTVPGFYAILEAGFRTVERTSIQLGAVSLAAQYLAGSLWALLQAGIALALRSRLKGKP